MKDVNRGLFLLFVGMIASEIIELISGLDIGSVGTGVIAAVSVSSQALTEIRLVVYESTVNEPTEDDENDTVEDDQFDESTQTGTVIGGTLNLRSTASTTATRLARIPNGTTIPILGESGAWYKTQYDGNNGYVMKKYVQLVQIRWTISGTMTDESDADTLIAYASELGVTLTKKKG